MLHTTNDRLRRNNFDFLRALFAAMVCIVHAYQLSRFSELQFIESYFSSDVAVKAFFIVSGFLIFMSYERSSSMSSYIKKRVRRIYPAYFSVIIIAAIVFVAVSSEANEYYFSAQWLQYVISNLAFLNFLEPYLPGVFEENFFPAVNGALWTLKIEVMFYFSVPLFVVCFRWFGKLTTLLVFYFLSLAYVALCHYMSLCTGSTFYVELARQLPGQLSYFLAGAFFYYYLNVFEIWAKYFISAAVLILIINVFLSVTFLEPFALATVVVFAGLFFYLGKFGKYGDFSYGIYILHFPIIQVLLNSNWFIGKPWLFLISVITLTVIFSIALWHFVEKRFLLRNSHYLESISSSTR